MAVEVKAGSAVTVGNGPMAGTKGEVFYVSADGAWALIWRADDGAPFRAPVLDLTLPGGGGPALPPPPDPAGGWLGLSTSRGLLPDATFEPFSPSALWRVPASGAVHENSAAIIASILAQAKNKSGKAGPTPLKAGMAGLSKAPKADPADYSKPVYFADPGDPVVTLQMTGNATNISAGTKILCPAKFLPANGGDAHACIIQPNGDVYDLWETKAVANGVLSAKNGKRVRIDGNGLSSEATAAHFAIPAGLIRPAELMAGRIDHPLFCVIPAGSQQLDFGHGVKKDPSGAAFVFPAEQGDQTIAGANQPPMGCRARLNMPESSIRALKVQDWKKTVLTALAEYGFIMGDTGGSGFDFQFESGASYVAYDRPDPFVQLAKSLGLGAGSGSWAGTFMFDLASGIDWTLLQVLVPPSP